MLLRIINVILKRMSVKICSFASGSKGNCTFVSDGATHLLIDLGISACRVEKCLSAVGADADGVTVLVTHSHSDHIAGLKTFIKRHPSVRVLCQRKTAAAVDGAIATDAEFTVGGLHVKALAASHDVPCVGYVVSDGTHAVSVMTDVGVISREQVKAFGDCALVMLECNHDVAMLRANPNYTPMLKARILSSRGHLSNADCAEACACLATLGVKTFILAHLSQENNTPEKAFGAVDGAIRDIGVNDARVIVAAQDAMTGLFEVC